jgi:hypothetical protein
MDRNSYHVMINIDGGWRVVRRGAARAMRIFKTQKEAIKFAQNVSRTHHAELVIHRENGRLQERRSYASDPNVSKE